MFRSRACSEAERVQRPNVFRGRTCSEAERVQPVEEEYCHYGRLNRPKRPDSDLCRTFSRAAERKLVVRDVRLPNDEQSVNSIDNIDE